MAKKPSNSADGKPAAPARSRGAQAGTAAPAKSGETANMSHDQIRKRAYEIYLRRRGGPGDPVSDWTAAERELRAEAQAAKGSAKSSKGN